MTRIITDKDNRMRILRRALGGNIDGATGKKFSLDTKFSCLHCGQRFFGHELTVVHGDGAQDWILCKHYPSCDGSIIDLVPVDDDDEFTDEDLCPIDEIPHDEYDDDSSLGVIVDLRYLNKDN